ncbi:MAG: hypothetical protein RXR70_05155, partial [Acidilobus sp.]
MPRLTVYLATSGSPWVYGPLGINASALARPGVPLQEVLVEAERLGAEFADLRYYRARTLAV